MPQTKYEEKNGLFSNRAHQAARRLLYPLIFPSSALEFEAETLLHESKRGQILDGEMAVDRVVRVKRANLHKGLNFTIQERFRRPQYAHYKDITVTEWNNASNQPSELYKITAGVFLYGYYDEIDSRFIDAIAIDTNLFLYKLTVNAIKYRKRRNRKQQDFLAFTFDDLEQAGVVLFRLNQ